MRYIVLVVCLLFYSCSQNEKFDSFDSATWKQDKSACKDSRKALMNDFEGIRRELLGLAQDDVIDVLGRPDFQLLYKRNQKYYIYFIEPGIQCQGEKENSKARTVSIRFNAVGLASEIIFSQGKPI
jgi:outer membrane protein assembly factor BamE (lipoprotein component of BamABCDE complex)